MTLLNKTSVFIMLETSVELERALGNDNTKKPEKTDQFKSDLKTMMQGDFRALLILATVSDELERRDACG
ncbi:hypothetical protein D1B32_23580 [Oceanobacillus profundus]|uniref:Uncharacterized protein n=1 Tax=Oceanobacillus profundus TaxID=372463 RepID=A0A417Y9C6_9BACI|nr:hypothetical protein D1B32_23580 [Oceanobacillus profundus]